MLVTGNLLIIAIIGCVAVLFHFHTGSQPTSPLTKGAVTKTLANPSKTQLTARNYTSPAAANEPSSISLPSVGAQGYIQKVGIDQYDEMAAPTNVNLAGWYVNSLLPGQAGLSVIDGHVDGYHHNGGVFGKLAKLQPGDIFAITFGNGNKKSFEVKSLQLVTAAQVPSILFAHDPAIKSQLNLITCGGDYDGVSHTYDKRTVVVSSLVN
jgi:LPXTG-site transpeptidase (sortase) family protein